MQALLALPLDRGVRPDEIDSEALRDAAANGHVAVVKELLALPLDRNVRPDAHENEALCLAAGHGHLTVVRLLLALPRDHGVDPGAQDNWALRFAARGGHIAVVQELLALPLVYSKKALRDAVERDDKTLLRLFLLPSAVPVPPATLARLRHQDRVRALPTQLRDGTARAWRTPGAAFWP